MSGSISHVVGVSAGLAIATAGASAGAEKKDGDVVDADFEVVDENKKK